MPKEVEPLPAAREPEGVMLTAKSAALAPVITGVPRLRESVPRLCTTKTFVKAVPKSVLFEVEVELLPSGMVFPFPLIAISAVGIVGVEKPELTAPPVTQLEFADKRRKL